MDATQLERAKKALAEHDKVKTSIKTFHLPVVNLQLPGPCQVGRVMFRPGSDLDRLIEATGQLVPDTPRAEFNQRQREKQDARWATADVEAVSLEEARSAARDAIAVLRLYQGARYPFVSLERQTFGLTPDVGRSIEDHWVSRDGRVVGPGFQVHGILGDWTFKEADVAAFAETPEFAFLAETLRHHATAWNDVQRRVIVGLRIANQATRMLTPAIRSVLAAVAMESLLGDEPPKGRPHRVSVRYAYLTCDLTNVGSGLHGPSRPACVVLASLHRNYGWLANRVRELFPGGSCSAYDNCTELTYRRNALLHEGFQLEDPEWPGSLVGRFDGALMSFVRWTLKTGASGLAELDAEIDQLCALNPGLPSAR